MFKQLFSRIKSQKSKTNSISQTKSEIQDIQPINQKQQQSIQAFFPDYILPEINLVQTIPTVHYTVLENFPDLTASILGCSIVFHNLPYANRRVKEISTIDHPNLPYYAQYMLKVFQSHLYQPNHFLINDYPQGVGIMPHLDGPAYYPKVLVYSIGTAIIKFVKKGEQDRKLLLQDKSLHIFEGQAYTQYMHGISDHGVDCIFFKIKDGNITNASVDNFQQTLVYKQILRQDLNNLSECFIGQYEITRVYQNQEYTHQLSIPRKRRISVTIRHKYI